MKEGSPLFPLISTAALAAVLVAALWIACAFAASVAWEAARAIRNSQLTQLHLKGTK